MKERKKVINRKKYLTVRETALVFGVNDFTIRAWVDKGKLPGMRHPMNNYRLVYLSGIIKLAVKLHVSQSVIDDLKGRRENGKSNGRKNSTD